MSTRPAVIYLADLGKVAGDGARALRNPDHRGLRDLARRGALRNLAGRRRRRRVLRRRDPPWRCLKPALGRLPYEALADEIGYGDKRRSRGHADGEEIEIAA